MSAITYYSKSTRALRINVSAVVTSSHRKTLRRTLVTSAASSDSDYTFHSTTTTCRSKQSWLFGAAALLLGYSTTTVSKYETRRKIASTSLSLSSTTLCEGETTTTDDQSPGPHNDFGAVPVKNDPYANLPEVDEETTCDICNTFRKGPCRKYWRKTERCWKDGDSDKCLPYSTPFINCSMYYRNLYVLVMLDNFQEYVTAMENDAKSVSVRQFSDEITDNNSVPHVDIDWNPWQEFNKDFGPSFSQTIPSPPPPSRAHPITKPPLWNRLPDETEPILVPCNIKIPTHFISSRDDNKLMYLKIAYVTDQDGFVVGKYFKPSTSSTDDDSPNEGTTVSTESSESSKVVTTDNDTAPSTKSNISIESDVVDDGDVHAEISCILLPGETKSIIVTAYYSDESLSDFSVDNDESEEDACVYKKEYDLYKMIS